jgi:hypothetical protein
MATTSYVKQPIPLVIFNHLLTLALDSAVEVTMLSTVESGIGIIAVSMSALQPLWTTWRRRWASKARSPDMSWSGGGKMGRSSYIKVDESTGKRSNASKQKFGPETLSEISMLDNTIIRDEEEGEVAVMNDSKRTPQMVESRQFPDRSPRTPAAVYTF